MLHSANLHEWIQCLLTASCPAPFIYVFGAPNTGKTTVLRSVLATCALGDQSKWLVGHDASRMLKTLGHSSLASAARSSKYRFLILDNAEIAARSDLTLIPALLTFRASIILISTMAWPIFCSNFLPCGGKPPLLIHFPRHRHALRPSDEALFQQAKSLHDDPVEQSNWIDSTEPFWQADNNDPLMEAFREGFCFADGKALTNKTIVLPVYEQWMILAGYLAGILPRKKDISLFAIQTKRKRKKARIDSLNTDAGRHPFTIPSQVFSVERLLAIFHSIFTTMIHGSVQAHTVVSRLVSNGYFERVTTKAARSRTDIERLRCCVDYESALKISQSLDFQLANFLVNVE